MVLPFSPDELSAVPDGFDIEVADAVDDWPASAADAEFYVPSYRFSRRVVQVLPQLPRLRVVQTLTAGYDHILPLLPDGVTLCNASEIHATATSEHAVGLMIAAQRRLPELAVAQTRHEWDQQMTSSLADRRVLVVGAGHIGQAIRRRLDGFECSVTLVGRTARGEVRAIAELPQLLPQAEIVVLAVPHTPETEGIVDKDFLAAMPDGALLVNVGRGKLVVTESLVAELQAGRLRAAVDVTDPEPLPEDHPLWSAPNTFITPHQGGAATSMWPRAYRLVADQLQLISRGEPPRNVVAGPPAVPL